MTNYAKFTTRSAPLASEFGRDWATKLFGAAVLAQVPVFSRGPKKGLPKGCVCWVDVSIGGWNRSYGVMTPGLHSAWLGEDGYTSERAFRLEWGGRVQAVHGPRLYLFTDGSERMARERAAAVEHDRLQREEALAQTQHILVAWSTALPHLVGDAREMALSCRDQAAASLYRMEG